MILLARFDSTPRRGEFPVRINSESRFSLEILIDFGFFKHSVVDAKLVDDTRENTEFTIGSTVQTNVDMDVDPRVTR